MKAIQITKTGGPEVLAYVDLPTPVAGPSDVLVKAHAIGVNMPEVLVRRGTYGWMPPLPASASNGLRPFTRLSVASGFPTPACPPLPWSWTCCIVITRRLYPSGTGNGASRPLAAGTAADMRGWAPPAWLERDAPADQPRIQPLAPSSAHDEATAPPVRRRGNDLPHSLRPPSAPRAVKA